MTLILGVSIATALPSPVMAVEFVREWKVSVPVFGEMAPVGLVVDEAGGQ